MHVLHWVAVEADSIEDAFYEVVNSLEVDEGRSWAEWSDWHVVGGGRWSNSQYEDSPELVKEYKSTPDSFEETLDWCRNARVEEVQSMFDRADIAKFEQSIHNYLHSGGNPDEKEKYDLNVYFFHKIAEILSGWYGSNSYFYDLVNHTSEMSYTYDRMKNNPTKQYLVPVDFHY